jgi:hypothetical protein
MFKYTKHFLKKTEDLFAEVKYVIRYERGSFKSGYCIVEDRKIAVINKFFDTEARINTLIEILNVIEVDVAKLKEGTASHYKALMKASAKTKGKETDTTEAVNEGIEEQKEESEETSTEIEETKTEEVE